MPRYPRKSQYKDKRDRVIFLLRSPKSKEFFVGQCLPDSLMPIFRQHCAGDRNYTDECFLALKKEGLHPCLTMLEQVHSTQVEAYRHVVAWTRIFVEAGYTCLNTGNISCYIDDLLEDTLAIYKQNKNRNIEEICACQACLVANYARKPCPMNPNATPCASQKPQKRGERDIVINIRLAEEEKIQIQENANACKKTVSAYVRETALNMYKIDVPFPEIEEHSKEIRDKKRAVIQLVYTLKKTGEFVPADLEYILDKTNEILKSEQRFVASWTQTLKHKSDEIAQLVRQRAETLMKGRAKQNQCHKLSKNHANI